MKSNCPSCSKSYNIDTSRVPPAGLEMRCAACSQSFRLFPDGVIRSEHSGDGAPLAVSARAIATERLYVRRRGGKVFGPFDAKAVEMMLRSKKLGADAELSVDKITWERVSGIPDFASIVREGDRGTAFEQSMETGARTQPAADETTAARTHYSDLIFKFAEIDGRICEAEQGAVEGWLADHPEKESFRGKYVDSMSPEEIKLVLEDLAFLSACDGEVSTGEASFIQDMAKDAGVDSYWAVQLLAGARRLADEIRSHPQEIVHEITADLSEKETAKEALALAMVGASTGALALGVARELAERIVVNKAQTYVLQGAAEELSRVGVPFPLEFLESCVVELPELGVAKIPVIGMAKAAHRAAKGDFAGAAVQGVASGGGMVGGAAAGAVAGSIAYAGFSGALLKGAVALGLASPPTAVVVAPILGGAAGALAISRAIKWYRKDD